MSYILDALRRAEAERDRGTLPGLNTHMGMPVFVDRQRLGRGNPWLWLLAGMVAAVLLVIGVRLWWGWATAGVVAAPAVAVPAAAVVPTPVLQPAVPATPPPVAAAPAAVVAVVVAPPTLPDRVAAPADTTSARAQAGAASAPASTPVPPSIATIAPPDGRIHAPAELPPEISRELPNLVFGGLIQLEDPPRRSLIINGVIYMEGEQIQPDLVLEQIRLNAAVLRYKGHRYQLPI